MQVCNDLVCGPHTIVNFSTKNNDFFYHCHDHGRPPALSYTEAFFTTIAKTSWKYNSRSLAVCPSQKGNFDCIAQVITVFSDCRSHYRLPDMAEQKIKIKIELTSRWISNDP